MPQNQKTDSVDPVQDLPDIQDNHILFARLIAEGKSQADAYRQAIGDDCQAASLWANASRLASNDKVRIWIDAFKREVFNSHAYTADKHVQELYEAVQLCKANGNMGALVNALKAIGQVSGHYIERHENVNETRKQELAERMNLLTNEKTEDQDTVH
jgi:hypothetical protein